MNHVLRSSLLTSFVLFAWGCSAGQEPSGGGGNGAGSNTAGNGHGGGLSGCDNCFGDAYTPCKDDGTPGDPIPCPAACSPGIGCVDCIPGATVCVGNEVHACDAQGTTGELVETCDTNAGYTCADGACKTGCEIAADQPSNIGCEFWAADLDQQDGFNDPASAPWGIALSNTGELTANVTISINTAAYGQAVQTQDVAQLSVPPHSLITHILPTRELDCGPAPNTYTAPGTCLSSLAFRITSSAPIVVYQFNVFENAYSNDASLLLPTNALGGYYRVLGWGAGHPVPTSFPGLGTIIDRSYVTIVGTTPNTQVTVNPSWKVRGNPPIAATAKGGAITVTLGPFDVLNLETDDASFSDDPKTAADLSGTAVTADKPVAVFSGVETTGAPGAFEIPTSPNWGGDSCCLDHLEDQMFPLESVGTHYVVTRSPVRSTSSYREPDIIRFVGAAEPATITTTLPAPYNSFTLQPGEVKTTYAQDNFTATGDKPFIVGQILISNNYVDGPYIGDPSLTVYPPVEQFRTEYIIPTPGGWDQSWVIIAEEVGGTTTIDGQSTAGCQVEAAGTVEGKQYQSRKCPLSEGAHSLSGDKPFGIFAYGYGSAGSYAIAGGADVKRIYEPPPIQ
ncbi:MAG: IgGFc-binding protein [Polyangiaceae bacterium]